jgi:hypothetical protein
MRRLSNLFRNLLRSLADLWQAHPGYRVSAIASAVLAFLSFALPLWRVVPAARQQAFIPLHYNIYFGVDRFGPWYYVFVPAALGFTLLVMNLAFQAVFFRRERILSKFFAVATVISEIALFASVVFIVLLNL